MTRLLDYLKSSEFFARESCSRAVIPLPKNLSRKIARFLVPKIGPATGVKVELGISRTKADSQWNPVYNVFHRNFCCGN